MADINDFKLVKRICEKYADLLLSELQIKKEFNSPEDKERLGFYPFVLENICGIPEISDICKLITDTHFHSQLYGKKVVDSGVDAVYIDEDKNTINLFNFKYRNKFKPNTNTLSPNETIISLKFVNAILTEDKQGLDKKIKFYVEKIIEKLSGNETWALKLFVVSNEDIEAQHSDPDLKRLEDHYGLEIEWFGLTKIMESIPMRPKAISADLILDNDAIMSFSESSISSSKSYIIRLPIDEVIRITCNNKILREKYNLENVEELEDIDLEYSLLFDNVRGFITRSRYNSNILDSLKKEPSKFFYYNNGLTIVAKSIQADQVNVNKRVKIHLDGFQVINGGQTLRTIHKFHQMDKQNIVDYLSDAQVLVRIFNTASKQELNNRIAEYTNSQNSVSEIELKSNRKEQIQLERYLLENHILYKRKTGDFKFLVEENIETSQYHQISMERFGQILYSIQGYPHKASSRKKDIFGKYYDSVFGEGKLEIQESANYVLKYIEIKEKYSSISQQDDITEQQIFYILFLTNRYNIQITNAISFFEEKLKDFKSQNRNSRPLISIKFKEYLEEKLQEVSIVGD